MAKKKKKSMAISIRRENNSSIGNGRNDEEEGNTLLLKTQPVAPADVPTVGNLLTRRLLGLIILSLVLLLIYVLFPSESPKVEVADDGNSERLDDGLEGEESDPEETEDGHGDDPSSGDPDVLDGTFEFERTPYVPLENATTSNPTTSVPATTLRPTTAIPTRSVGPTFVPTITNSTTTNSSTSTPATKSPSAPTSKPTSLLVAQESTASPSPSNEDESDLSTFLPFGGAGINGINWYQTIDHVKRLVKHCKASLDPSFGLSLAERRIREADCGTGYFEQFAPPNATAYLHNQQRLVALFGPWTEIMRWLSGCAYGKQNCPLTPQCEMVHYFKSLPVMHRIDVVIVPVLDHWYLKQVHETHPRAAKVLHWREAVWSAKAMPGVREQLDPTFYDILHGVQHFSDMRTPNFLVQPSFLLQGVHQDVKPDLFAASLMSDCATRSARATYVSAMASILGNDRLHQYGRCGDRDMSGATIGEAMRVLSSFLAFENTIQNGYTSEKLFWSLMMPVVPVYYGDLTAPNITNTPSYIRVADFSSPKKLCEYLLYLDKNDAAYNQYHVWRGNPESISDAYLEEYSTHVPGPKEILPFMNVRKDPDSVDLAKSVLNQRKAMCCRFCNPKYVTDRVWRRRRRLMKMRNHELDPHEVLVYPPMGLPEIRQRYYQPEPPTEG